MGLEGGGEREGTREGSWFDLDEVREAPEKGAGDLVMNLVGRQMGHRVDRGKKEGRARQKNMHRTGGPREYVSLKAASSP